MQTINLEAGMPQHSEAMNNLNNRIYAVRASGAKLVKIIHGYGSSGKGGAIRRACRQKLPEYRRRGIIKDMCPGENLGPFSEEGRAFASKCPEVRSDPDWGRNNPGITVVRIR